MDRQGKPIWNRSETPSHAAGRKRPLAGVRILVVEDEIIVALDIQASLEDSGAIVVGPAHTLGRALELAERERISAAILDLRVGRDPVGPVAHLLTRRNIPFLFHSGQTADDPLRAEWPQAPLVSKPTSARRLAEAVASLLD